jgi:hypothetical protein
MSLAFAQGADGIRVGREEMKAIAIWSLKSGDTLKVTLARLGWKSRGLQPVYKPHLRMGLASVLSL